MPSRSLRPFVIAIATAVCLAGIPVGQGGSPATHDSGRAPVQLSAPVGHAPAAIHVTRVDESASFIHGAVCAAPPLIFRPSNPPSRPLPADPAGAFRDAWRMLPLAPRAPPRA